MSWHEKRQIVKRGDGTRVFVRKDFDVLAIPHSHYTLPTGYDNNPRSVFNGDMVFDISVANGVPIYVEEIHVNIRGHRSDFYWEIIGIDKDGTRDTYLPSQLRKDTIYS
jgi:hypothetical protein